MHAHEANEWVVFLKGADRDERWQEQHYICCVECHVRRPRIQISLECYCGSSSSLLAGTWQYPWPIFCHHCGWKHVPWLAMCCKLFLRRNGVITCEVISGGHYSPALKFVDKTFVEGSITMWNLLKFLPMKVSSLQYSLLFGLIHTLHICTF